MKANKWVAMLATCSALVVSLTLYAQFAESSAVSAQPSDKVATRSAPNSNNPKNEKIFLHCSVKQEDFIYNNAEPVDANFQIRRGIKGWELGYWNSRNYDFQSSYVNIDPYFSRSMIGSVKVYDDAIVIESHKDAGITYMRQVIGRHDGSWNWYYDTGSSVRQYPTAGTCTASVDRSASRKF